MTARPMCDAWYERAGDYRPWHSHQDASCGCGLTAHYLPEHHARDCLVYQAWVRAELLDQLISGVPER